MISDYLKKRIVIKIVQEPNRTYAICVIACVSLSSTQISGWVSFISLPCVSFFFTLLPMMIITGIFLRYNINHKIKRHTKQNKTKQKQSPYGWAFSHHIHWIHTVGSFYRDTSHVRQIDILNSGRE